MQSFDDANDMTKAIEARLTASALQLADRGFFVLRCAPGDKRPMDFWKNTLSNDQRKVASQWGSTPDANVGVACMESGIFVIDVDGELGETTLHELTTRYGALPKTVEVRTPGRGGGRHLWFKAVEGVQLKAALGEGLDIKHNGYVLAPPSVHPEGGMYRWQNSPNNARIADAPDWLLALARRNIIEDLPVREEAPTKIAGQYTKVEDWFDATFTAQDVMHDVLQRQQPGTLAWSYHGLQNGNHAYTRPGKSVNDGLSLIVYRYSTQPIRICSQHTNDGRCPHCMFTRAQMFSTAMPDTPAGSYGPFRLYVHIRHGDDFHAALDTLKQFGFAGEMYVPPPKSVTDNDAPTPDDLLVGQYADTLRPLVKRWVVPKLVPEGELTLITGAPGASKSLVAVDIIARLSRGDTFPTGKGCLEGPQRCLLLTGEEDVNSVVLPRLEAAGANMRNVMVSVKLFRAMTASNSEFSFRGIPQLEALLIEENIKVIVFDVIKSFMRHNDDNKELEVRRELQPLADLCHRSNVTVIGARHTKKTVIEASMAGSGSIAYNAICRSECLITQDADHEGKPICTLTVTKSSYGEKGIQWEYRIASKEINAFDPSLQKMVPVVTPYLDWAVGGMRADPDSIVAPKEERSKDRVFREACIRTLSGAAALGYELPMADFRRIVSEHLTELDFQGGINDRSIQNYENKMIQAGILIRERDFLGFHTKPNGEKAMGGTKSKLILAEQYRRTPATETLEIVGV